MKDIAKLYEELRSIIDGGSESFTHEDAVQYLKDKLAQPELCKYGQERKSCTSSPMDCQCVIDAALAQPEQEPVAWGMMNDDGSIYDCICPEEHERVEGEYTIPLYTTPPQRTWVGLTDDEKQKIMWVFTQPNGLFKHFKYMEAVEAKLKEKNNAL